MASSAALRPFSLSLRIEHPLARWAWRGARHWLEGALAFPRLNLIYARTRRMDRRRDFCDRALDALRLRYTLDPGDEERIPKTGPLIVVCNHPFGGADGIILLSLLRRIRPDVRLLANFLLGTIPEMREWLFMVDPFGGPGAVARNIGATKAALRWIGAGGVLGVFPAGEVSHLTLQKGCVTDPEWSDAIGRIAQRSGAPVLSVYFDGRNGPLFQAAGLVHPRLRTALLPRALLRMQSKTVRVHVGNTISSRKLATFPSAGELTEYLRLRTYILKSRGAIPARAHAVRPVVPTNCEPIAAAIEPAALISEIEALPADQRLLDFNEMTVFFTRAQQSPRMLLEIGRLREVSFRPVGEGTGKARDLDAFDDYYLHLCVWNKAKRHLVGAYRVGLSSEILPRHGLEGLYTQSLFRYPAALIERIGPAFEMGRSFVTANYQKSYSSLLLLWKGIGRLLLRWPEYRSLFGAVSISDEYHTMTKQLLMAFLKATNFRDDLAPLVHPRTPPRIRRWRDAGKTPLTSVIRGVEEVEDLVTEIEGSQRGIPILLRQYLRLNGKLLGFNIDPDFGNVLDGLVLVDVPGVERSVLQRYMGDGTDGYLTRHLHAD